MVLFRIGYLWHYCDMGLYQTLRVVDALKLLRLIWYKPLDGWQQLWTSSVRAVKYGRPHQTLNSRSLMILCIQADLLYPEWCVPWGSHFTAFLSSDNNIR